jgi:hypothetical protein
MTEPCHNDIITYVDVIYGTGTPTSIRQQNPTLDLAIFTNTTNNQPLHHHLLWEWLLLSPRISESSYEWLQRSGSNDVKSALPSDSNYKLPDLDGMLSSLNREIRELNLEAKRLFHEMEVEEKEMQEALEEVKKWDEKIRRKGSRGTNS